MEKYDVIVIGSGLGSLTTATFLSKRLRNVAVFEDGNKEKLLSYSTKIKDKNNNKFDFSFFNRNLGGPNKDGLFYNYIKRCGMEKAFEYYENKTTAIVYSEEKTLVRPNDFISFRTYLVRYYPKQRDNIHSLFNDISRHYDDYKLQKLSKLANQEFTIPSLLIEWGDLNLQDVLSKYFTNQALIDEFTLVHDSVGHNAKDINSYNYFIKFFDTFIDGSYFIKTPFKDVVKGFSSEISKTRQRIFTNKRIKQFVFKDDEIYKLIDEDDNEIQAKHYVINMRIDDFINEYLDGNEEVNNHFYEMYRTIKEDQYINQVYLGLDKSPEELGLTHQEYMFKALGEQVRLLSVTNYKLLDNTSSKDGTTGLLVEFLDQTISRKEMMNKVIDQLVQYFPQLSDHIVASKIGVKKPFFSGIPEEEFWFDKTINDKFSIHDYSAFNPFKNGYFIGSWLRPEAGVSGMIQTGVEYGDMIDELIYHGDDEDYFITHDELMVIITNQFIPGSLGKKEKNIQFFIGKDSYYIRTKDKRQRLYKGVSDISDIIIIATNEGLYDLTVGNTTLEKALSSGLLEFVGEKEFLDEVVEAFDMGIEVTSTANFSYIPGRWGMKSAIVILGILMLSNLLANYHPYTIIAPSTIALLAGVGYYKYRKIQYISKFEIVSVSLYFILLVLSIIFPEVNNYEDSKFTTLFFAVYLLFTWLINRPVLFGFIKYDYRTDYTRTKLFLKMAGGLTFIWGFIFLTISFFSFQTISSYSSLTYYLVALGLYLMYYYPTSYIKGNISRWWYEYINNNWDIGCLVNI